MIEVDGVDFHYGKTKALHGINLKIPEKKVTAFIGPSGCGKSTLLRCFNRMNDLLDHARVTAGTIKIEGVNINAPDVDVIELRRRVGMVFQKSNPFPKSIYENIAYGLAHRRGSREGRYRADGRIEPERSRPVGRGKGPVTGERSWAFRGPAAAPLHCTSVGGQAGNHPDG